MRDENQALTQLVAQVLESGKYRTVCPETVRRVGERELARRRNLKEAVKETKNTLHQIAGAYLEQKPRYTEWTRRLAEILPEEREALGMELMRHHASTAERLPFVREFYATLFGALDAPPCSILDVACGLNALALPLMPLAPNARYVGCDLFSDQAEFLNHWLNECQFVGQCEVRDVIAQPPDTPADVALILKLLPVLEQWDKNAGMALLRALPCPTLIVSFPTRSLSGKSKGMADNYATRFLAQITAENWHAQRFDFPNEMAFVVKK
jgi:16S rRNA (guanine(1405)-N(7))-methyltransferase